MKMKDKLAYRRKLARRNDEGAKAERERIARKAINEIQVVSAYVLQSEFGFGRKRLCRFLKAFYDVHGAVSKGDVSLYALAEEVKDKTGVVYDQEEMSWTDGEDDT